MATFSRLSEIAIPWITEALQNHAGNENVRWELGLSVFPDPSATDPLTGYSTDPSSEAGLLPALTLFLEITTSDPSITAYISPLIPANNLSQESVDNVVRLALEALFQARRAREAGSLAEELDISAGASA